MDQFDQVDLRLLPKAIQFIAAERFGDNGVPSVPTLDELQKDTGADTVSSILKYAHKHNITASDIEAKISEIKDNDKTKLEQNQMISNLDLYMKHIASLWNRNDRALFEIDQKVVVLTGCQLEMPVFGRVSTYNPETGMMILYCSRMRLYYDGNGKSHMECVPDWDCNPDPPIVWHGNIRTHNGASILCRVVPFSKNKTYWYNNETKEERKCVGSHKLWGDEYFVPDKVEESSKEEHYAYHGDDETDE